MSDTSSAVGRLSSTGPVLLLLEGESVAGLSICIIGAGVGVFSKS